MKWSVEELLRLGNEKLLINEEVNVGSVKERDEQIRHISPVHVQGEAYLNHSVISFHLHLTGEMVLPCSLTLEDVDYPFSIDTIETFPIEQTSIELEEEENEVIHEFEGQTIDLMPIIEENLLLSIPMKIVHPQAKMISSGEGWDIVTGEEKDDKIDPRMAKLANFFKKEDEEK